MAKIGVLDSGLGGLSVLREIHRLLPTYHTVYVADQAYAPYGERPAAQILERVDAITRFLLSQQVDVVVLACHAASAAALYPLRETYPDMTFVGIEPAVKPAVQRSQSGVVGVLTTHATAEGALYRRVVERFAVGTRVITTPAPELVLDVERGDFNSDIALAHVRERVQPMLAAGADQIVLACTHFPFLEDVLWVVVGDAAELVDPGAAVAQQVGRVTKGRLTAEKEYYADNDYFTTGDAQRFRTHLAQLLGIDAAVEHVTLHVTTSNPHE